MLSLRLPLNIILLTWKHSRTNTRNVPGKCWQLVSHIEEYVAIWCCRIICSLNAAKMRGHPSNESQPKRTTFKIYLLFLKRLKSQDSSTHFFMSRKNKKKLNQEQMRLLMVRRLIDWIDPKTSNIILNLDYNIEYNEHRTKLKMKPKV